MKTIWVKSGVLNRDYPVDVPKPVWRKLRAYQQQGEEFPISTGLEYFLWAIFGPPEERTDNFLQGSALGCCHCHFFLGIGEIPEIPSVCRLKFLRQAATPDHVLANYALIANYVEELDRSEFFTCLEICLRANYLVQKCYAVLKQWDPPGYVVYLEKFWKQGLVSAGEKRLIVYFDQIDTSGARPFKQLARQLQTRVAYFYLGIYYHDRLNSLVSPTGEMGQKLRQKVLAAFQLAIQLGCLKSSWRTCLVYLNDPTPPPEIWRCLWHLAAIDYQTAANRLMVHYRETGQFAEFKYLARREMNRVSHEIINTQTAHGVFADYYIQNKHQPKKAVPYLLAGARLGSAGCQKVLLTLPRYCYTQEVLDYSLEDHQDDLTNICISILYPSSSLTISTLKFSLDQGLTILTTRCFSHMPVSRKVYRFAFEHNYEVLLNRCREELDINLKIVQLALQYHDLPLLHQCINQLPITPGLLHVSLRLNSTEVPDSYRNFRRWYIDGLFEFYRYAPTYFSRWIVGDVARLICLYLD